MQNNCRSTVLYVLAFFTLLCSSSISLAGGGSAKPGQIVTYESDISYIAQRHAIGLDYALTDEEFLGQLESLAIQGALRVNGVPANAVMVTIAIKDAFEAMDGLKNEGINFKTINKAVRTVLETVIIPAKAAVPGLGEAISALKLSFAFTTAYVYGFFWGK